MREYESPATVMVRDSGNLSDLVVRNAVESPDGVTSYRRSGTGWEEVSCARFLDEVRAVAKGLVAAGVAPGDRVALRASNSYEWMLVDFAIWFAGAVSVPVYATSSADQLAWILEDSGASALVTGAGAAGAEEGVPDLPRHWTLPDAVAQLRDVGKQVSDEELERRRSLATPESAATIIYTSGTTGEPKGCVLTHGNFMVELDVAISELDELFADDDAVTLLFLPLAHVFARIVQVGAVRARVPLAHTADVKRLLADLTQVRPTFLLGVPRVFETMFNTMSQEAAANGRGRIFDRAAESAIALSRAQDRGRPGLALRARHRVFDRLVYSAVREALGGRCRYLVSGGAPLGERLAHFYRGAGLTVLEGYGLTETTGAVTLNVPDFCRIGSVGRPLPGVAVRVADDGELLVRGPQVFAGYWKAPDQTRSVLTPDGWLHTGDLGEIDDEGFVRVTGRKNEIIVTAGGKVVSPTALEQRIRAHPLVSQCMVVGDGRPYVAALVTLDPDAAAAWASENGKGRDLTRLAEDTDLRAQVQAAVDEANRTVSQAESVRRFAILPAEWSEESGQLTPSLKLRRNVVMREARLHIEQLYST